jgi:hypothetical protein
MSSAVKHATPASPPDRYQWAEFACRVVCPLALDQVGLYRFADQLRAISPIVDETTVDAARDAVFEPMHPRWLYIDKGTTPERAAAVRAVLDILDKTRNILGAEIRWPKWYQKMFPSPDEYGRYEAEHVAETCVELGVHRGTEWETPIGLLARGWSGSFDEFSATWNAIAV